VAIHFIVLAIPAVHLDNGGLVTIGIGIRGRATECLGPVSGESLDMLRVEAVAERMGDHIIGHHPTMPGFGKTAQAVVATRRLEDSLHTSMMTILPCLRKTMAAASSAGRRRPTGTAKYGSRLVAKGSNPVLHRDGFDSPLLRYEPRLGSSRSSGG
jgi:hypothetical protein